MLLLVEYKNNKIKAYQSLQLDNDKMYFEFDGDSSMSRFHSGKKLAFYGNGDFSIELLSIEMPRFLLQSNLVWIIIFNF